MITAVSQESLCTLAREQLPDGRYFHKCTICGRERITSKRLVFGYKHLRPGEKRVSIEGQDNVVVKLVVTNQPIVQRGPCKHRGVELDRRKCSTCKGNVLVKIFHCPKMFECSIERRLPGVQACSECPAWESCES